MAAAVQPAEKQIKRQRLQSVSDDAPPGAAAAATDSSPRHEQPPPRLVALWQTPALLPREPSPGAMHGCRIAAWARLGADGSSPSTYGAALASGAHVFWSQQRLSAGGAELRDEQLGKEGVLLPLRLSAPAVMQLQALPAHAGEVQALALVPVGAAGQASSSMLLATVDAWGAGSISRLSPCWEYAAAAHSREEADDTADTAAVAGPVAPPAVEVTACLQPLDPCREGGWAGVCFSSSGSDAAAAAADPALLATARGFAKDVALYDVASGKPLASFGCISNPHALTFLPPGACNSAGSSLLAVAEGHTVCVWDVRAGGGRSSSSCVQRYTPGSIGLPLYALAWSSAQAGLLGAAGAERSLFMTEPRKWRMVTKWGGAARQAIHSVAFLDNDPHCAVLAGLDLEVLCGRWDKPGSASRPFQSTGTAAGGEGAGGQAAAAAAAAGGGGGGRAAAAAAAGAHGSGDGSKRGTSAAAAAAAAAAGGDGGDAADAAGSLEEGAGGGTCAATAVFSYRGDGRWLGVSKAAGSDVLAGFASTGNLVYARAC